MLKKRFLIIFLGGLLNGPLLFSAHFLISKFLIEWKMEEALEVLHLVTVTVQKDKVIWLKKDKEALINGEPFDVKTITQAGTTLVFKGLFDKEEKALKKKLCRQQDDGAAQRAEAFRELISAAFYLQEYLAQNVAVVSCGHIFSLHILRDLPIANYPIPLPPPRKRQRWF